MDVSSLATAIVGLTSARTAASVQFAAAAKLLDVQRVQGDAVLQLLQAATQQVDAAASQVLESTQQMLDVYA